jgi:hypothetical protein
MAKAIIYFSSLVVNEKGLHATTGERVYPVDGLHVNWNELQKHVNHQSGMNDNMFYATKVNAFQTIINNRVNFYYEKRDSK